MAYRMPEHIVTLRDTVDHRLTMERMGSRRMPLLNVRCLVWPCWYRRRECICGWPGDTEAGLVLVVRRGSVGLRSVI
jgi:hypothetical protein